MDRKTMLMEGREFKFVLGIRSADVAGDIAGVDNLLDYLIALATATSQNFTRTAYYKTAQRAPGCCQLLWMELWHNVDKIALFRNHVTVRRPSRKSTKYVYLSKCNNLISSWKHINFNIKSYTVENLNNILIIS